jgi:predicted DNA-binding transcriptional regulator
VTPQFLWDMRVDGGWVDGYIFAPKWTSSLLEKTETETVMTEWEELEGWKHVRLYESNL